MFAHPGRNGDDDDDEVSHSIMNVCGEEKKKSSLQHIYYSAFLLQDFQKSTRATAIPSIKK